MARLHSNLSRIASACPQAASAALLQTGADLVNLTKQLTPVDTGALKQSYGALPQSSTVIHIGSDMEYAPYVEYGTVHSPSQPHLTPAFMHSQKTFHTRLMQEMKKINGVS